jgi:hypothetical protein
MNMTQRSEELREIGISEETIQMLTAVQLAEGGVYYLAKITEWDGTQEFVHVQRNGDDVDLYYKDGQHHETSFNEYGELVEERAQKFVRMPVSYTYFCTALNPDIIRKEAPDFAVQYFKYN